ncbi:YdeI/OmpD-associated family protein [Stackebrandtia nassauensis]|uniref:OmdA domain containing protein n=1 Tax=Stackebrandtia nassauensis (strain DSM 44728 / CIP 108903 / NRRL B-16338 / NBRC 102104 / LLR-40K-21) TaxID=446470 RepID=D3PXF1_STANL|nr:YdeI/OmpD-associated family protein [Stackebrandtia nassauensis]ADD41414.1 conserved hypothetical protein [Stackebrandtia nassauensis DSM 44728]
MDILDFPDVAAWEAWLERNHGEHTEAWLRIAKKNSPLTTLAIGDALDGALCFGWIDGQRKGLDEASFLQRYSKRRRRSSWSQVNVAKAESLIAAGRMRPAGFAEIEAAKADGRWDAAYVKQSEFTVPSDVATALAGNPTAAAAFGELGKSDQYLLVLPLLKTRTPETRAKSLNRLLERLTDPR